MRILTTKITKLVATAAATAMFGLAPALVSAHSRDRDHYDDEGDRQVTHRDVHVDIEVSRDHSEPVYEERVSRVWVEPVYRLVTDRRWVEPETRTVSDRVWREPVVEDRLVERRVPSHWETREFIHDDGYGGRVVSHERVYVVAHTEKQHQDVLVCPGHWEDVQRQEVVCPGHWETCDRQEIVCAGHWEERTEHVVVERHHDGLDVIAGIVAHIGR